jgi:sugar/nucleoside kinase (ribokinase family)
VSKISTQLLAFEKLFLIHSYKTQIISLGGSALNSSRMLANLGEKNLMFFGATGDDLNGIFIKESVEKSGVEARYGNLLKTIVKRKRWLLLNCI